jgi:hypothetical protein
LRLGYEFRSNPFSLTNQSSSEVDLKGWRLGSVEASFEYELPDYLLPAGETIFFWWGAANSEKDQYPTNVFLEGLVVPAAGARIQLVNPDNTVVDSITLRRTVQVRRRKNSENCLVM